MLTVITEINDKFKDGKHETIKKNWLHRVENIKPDCWK